MNRMPHASEWVPASSPFGSRPDDRTSPEGERSLITIREVGTLLRRHGRLLALWIALCIATAAWYIHTTPPEYTASTLVILEPRRQAGAGPDPAGGAAPPTLDSAQAESQIQVVRSERILAFVFDLLDLADAPELAAKPPGLRQRLQAVALRLLPGNASPFGTIGDPAKARASAFQGFSDRVGVRRIGQSYVLEISYRALSPDQAARLANAITSAYIRAQVVFKAAAATRGTEFLQGRITDLRAEQEAALDGIRRGAIPDVQFPDADARVISAALVPLGKSFPQTGLVFAFAVALGALTGAAAIAARHSLDRTVRSRQQLARVSGLACLGAIPLVGRTRGFRGSRTGSWLGRAVIDDPHGVLAQAMRAARTAVLIALPEQRTRTVGVVSWSRGEGRTTVAGNLAQLLSVTGEQTVLIDGDLANPVLSRALCPDEPAGLGDALSRHLAFPDLPTATLTDALRCVPAVGPAGIVDPNVYLGSPEMQGHLARLRDAGDIVIDLPPLGLSSDAQAISRFLDGVVLVVELGRTSLDDVDDAVRVLTAANARILGVLLNKSRPGHAG